MNDTLGMWVALTALLSSRAAAGPSAELRPTDLVHRYGRAVVLVAARTRNGQLLQGTGFLVSPRGMVVTNFHVIEGAILVRVRLTDGRTYDSRRVVSSDSDKDLAVLEIGGSGFPTVLLGDSGTVSVGSRVYVIGNPRGLENTISDGLLSGRRHFGHDQVLQMSAPISPGSSGSPVFDSCGRVIGVARATVAGGQNLNLAVPVNYVRRLLGASAGPDRAAARPKPPTTKAAKRSPRPVPSGPAALGSRHVLRGHIGEANWVTWSPNGKRLASGGVDGTVRIWSAVSGRQLAVLHAPSDHDLSISSPAASWSPDSRYFAWSVDGGVRVCAGDTGRLLTTLPALNAGLDISWSPDCKRLAYVCDARVMIWDKVAAPQAVPVNQGGLHCATLAWSPDSADLAIAGEEVSADDGEGNHTTSVSIWEVRTCQRVARVGCGTELIKSLTWSPDGRRLASAGWGDRSHVWDVSSASELTAIGSDQGVGASVCWSSNGRQLAACIGDTVHIWDAATYNEVAFLAGSPLQRGAWCPRGARFAWIVGKDLGHVKIWDAETGSDRVIAALSNGGLDLAWGPDGRQLAVRQPSAEQWGCDIRIWNAATNSLLLLRDRGCNVNSLAWSPKGGRLAAACADGTIRLWDLGDATELDLARRTR